MNIINYMMVLLTATEQFNTSVENLLGIVEPIVYVLIAVAIVFNGVGMIIGGEEGKEKAKKAFPWILLGAILVIGAINIGDTIVSNISFGD